MVVCCWYCRFLSFCRSSCAVFVVLEDLIKLSFFKLLRCFKSSRFPLKRKLLVFWLVMSFSKCTVVFFLMLPLFLMYTRDALVLTCNTCNLLFWQSGGEHKGIRMQSRGYTGWSSWMRLWKYKWPHFQNQLIFGLWASNQLPQTSDNSSSSSSALSNILVIKLCYWFPFHTEISTVWTIFSQTRSVQTPMAGNHPKTSPPLLIFT